jgi:hypothetical protein
MYWITVIIAFLSMLYYEKKGHWLFLKADKVVAAAEDSDSGPNKAGGRSKEGVFTSSGNDRADGP